MALGGEPSLSNPPAEYPLFILSKRDEARMPQVIVRRPLGELELAPLAPALEPSVRLGYCVSII